MSKNVCEKNDGLKTLLESYPDVEFLKADGFDEAVIGYDEQGERLIYSVFMCLEILVDDGSMLYEEAREYFEFNVSGSYVGEKTPIWCYTGLE